MRRMTRAALVAILILPAAFLGCDADRPVGHDMEAERDGLVFDQTTSPLNLVSICAGVFRVDNRTPSPQTFTWDHVSTKVVGAGEVPANERVYFRTPHDAGPNTTRLHVSGFQVTKASNNQPCQYVLTGTVYNDANVSGQQDGVETGFAGLTVRLYDDGGAVIADALTDASGAYVFDTPRLAYGTTYRIGLPESTAADDNNEVIVPYYVPTSPSSLPNEFTFVDPTGLDSIGAVAPTFGSEVKNLGLQLNPTWLREAFEGNKLVRDTRDDHFWWQQMKRAQAGRGAQNNATVKRDELLRLLHLIEYGGNGVNPFFSDPFQFGSDPIRTAEQILQPPGNRNDQQRQFLSALLTVWLNRVYATNINTVLLDGLLLSAEQAYNSEETPFTMQTRASGNTSATMLQQSTFSTDLYTSTLSATYRSGSGGIGSN
jgi:hypothetical protein